VGAQVDRKENIVSIALTEAVAQPIPQSPKTARDRVTKRINFRQAANMMAAVAFAREIGTPLNAHATIHWSLTDVGDDPEGKLFAKVREGLDKWLNRRGAEFLAAWARERQSGGQSDVEHCHLLFHLPAHYRTGKKLCQVESAISRLVELHGRGILHENAVDLRVHHNPDGKYLIKGGGPKIWRRFGVQKKDRRLQGLIFGKRCGTTENLGLAARSAKRSQQHYQTSGG
jgi:hypothetical protein